MTTTLQTISGIQARIFNLPERLPFMIASDLAEVYGTTPSRINQAVKRNPDRFPEDFMFVLTEEDIEALRSQSVTANMSRYAPRGFTHAGALMLSAVLKTKVAAEVSVTIHRAFAAMEAQALREVDFLLKRVQSDALFRKPVRGRIQKAVEWGMTFDQLHETVSLSKVRLTQAIRDCIHLGLIETVPEGTTFIIPLVTSDARQGEMFDG